MPRLRLRVVIGIWAAAVLVLTWLLAAITGGSGPEDTRLACAAEASTLSSIDPITGQVTWRTTLTQATEYPVQIHGWTAIVTGRCGAVVDIADGDVLYDGAASGEHPGVGGVIGVIGTRLFLREDVENPEVREGVRSGIRAINLDTGQREWSHSASVELQDALVAADSLLILHGTELEARDRFDGLAAWQVRLPACCTRLVSSGRLILAIGGDGSTFAFDLADGTLVWRTIPPVMDVGYGMRITSVRGTVLTAANTSDEPDSFFVYATNARTGQLRWTHPAMSVLSADRQITVLRAHEAVEAVDTRTGALLWSHPAPTVIEYESIPPAALTSDTVVVQQLGSTAMGLDRNTGQVLWDGMETTSVLAAGEVVLGLTDDGVIALEARTGAARWSLTQERARQQFAVSPDGQLLHLDSDATPPPVMDDCC